MKRIFSVLIISIFISCSGNAQDKTKTDSKNKENKQYAVSKTEEEWKKFYLQWNIMYCEKLVQKEHLLVL